MNIPAIREIYTDDDGDEQWSESKIFREWVRKVPRPDGSVPLNFQTVDGYKLFDLTLDGAEQPSYALWVTHSNGVEMPISNTGVPTIKSSNPDFGNGHSVELSDQFKDELYLTLHQYVLFPYENLEENEYGKRFVTEYPDGLRDIEVWAMETIVGHFVHMAIHERYDGIPYELAWIVENTIQYAEERGGDGNAERTDQKEVCEA